MANPNGVPGINLIFDVGQGGVFSGGSQVVDTTGEGDGLLETDTSGLDYDNHYNFDFAPNRKGYFHYTLMVHRFVYIDGRTDYSGVAEVSAGLMRDEMVVSLYCLRTPRNLGYALAHELGHNLGLRHGGDTNCNNKPNYNSIMNYRFSFVGIDTDCDGHVSLGPADFSQGLRNTLDENSLNEAVGLCGGVPLDWNGIHGIETGVQRDVNAYNGQVGDCRGTHTVLTDHDDWAKLVVDMTPNGDEPGNVPDELVVCPPPEVTQ